MKILFEATSNFDFVLPLHFELGLTIDNKPAHVSVGLTLGFVYLMIGLERKEKSNAA